MALHLIHGIGFPNLRQTAGTAVFVAFYILAYIDDSAKLTMREGPPPAPQTINFAEASI